MLELLRDYALKVFEENKFEDPRTLVLRIKLEKAVTNVRHTIYFSFNILSQPAAQGKFQGPLNLTFVLLLNLAQ